MEFSNVKVVKKANVYFDGRVTSRTVLFPNGERKTLGFMLAGEYSFNTGASEIMEIIGGEMDIRLQGGDSFSSYGEGTSFTVPANSSFDIIVKNYADYCCSYIEK